MTFRHHVVDFLPAMDAETPTLAVSKADISGQTNWQLYTSPFSNKLWIFLLGVHAPTARAAIVSAWMCTSCCLAFQELPPSSASP